MGAPGRAIGGGADNDPGRGTEGGAGGRAAGGAIEGIIGARRGVGAAGLGGTIAGDFSAASCGIATTSGIALTAGSSRDEGSGLSLGAAGGLAVSALTGNVTAVGEAVVADAEGACCCCWPANFPGVSTTVYVFPLKLRVPSTLAISPKS